jgi:hypothetical protein
MLVRLRDIPQLPKRSFSWRNSCRTAGVPAPCHLDLSSGRLKVDAEFQITGWCDNPDEQLMHGREGQIVLMFFHPEYGEIWEHYPLFDEDEREAAIFECTLPPLCKIVNGHAKVKPVKSKMPKLTQPSPRGSP